MGEERRGKAGGRKEGTKEGTVGSREKGVEAEGGHGTIRHHSFEQLPPPTRRIHAFANTVAFSRPYTFQQT